MSTNTYTHQVFLRGLPNDQRSPGWQQAVSEMRSWMQTEPQLPDVSDEHLLLFLHSCYGDQQRARAALLCYYRLRTRSRQLFAQRDPLLPELQKTLDIAQLVALPSLTPEGYRVLLYRLVQTAPHKMHFVTCLKLFLMWNDMQLSEGGLCAGYVVVFDMAGVTWGHVCRISLPAIRRFMHYTQDAHPARLKAVHVVNTVAFMDRVLALVKPLMKSELLHMLHLHGSPQSLARFMPLSILPEEYGGDAGPAQRLHDRYRHMMETDYLQWFQAEEAFKVDDSRRPDRQGAAGEPPEPPAQKCEDMEFSFRSLSID